MKKLSIHIMALCSVFGFASGAVAEDCRTAPDCADLGFTQNEADCSGAALKCPWNLTQVACNAIEPVTCAVGSILGGDQLCYADKLPKSVTPVGIVFDTTDMLAVALTDVKENGSAGTATMAWSAKSSDISALDNCSSTANLTTCGVDGRANTTAILNCGSSCGTTPAATATNSYEPSGCSKDFCKKTQWFLPSMRDLITLQEAKSSVNASLSLTSSSGATHLGDGYYWSSTEHNNPSYAWYLHMGKGTLEFNSKVITGNNVRPVIYYGEIKAGAILYGDGTVASGVVTGKTPIGIVFDPVDRLAVALTDVNSSGSASSIGMFWSSSYCYTPNLENCTSSDGLTSCGVDGRTNTNAILAASTCNGTTYAANGANAYEPSGCSKDFCKKTKWFLPSMRDLITLYNAKSSVNTSLSLTSSSGAKTLTESYYWSSTAYGSNYAWLLSMINGSWFYEVKDYSSHVRPVIKY